ncbi:nucleoside 2-deoxyribosyltransferase [Sulfurirhabdus autotrophica]|uniref:Nucleoside 2-deoxyribosyltransferase n=1 Tax=Sulfurirhabdus autotrophica TaxID=1706046 RepID=A0A4R3YFV0_9PROT|nr:nucleoside 2-deoxyribosyltransferase [Sulfurirhabdus autotrophica]TCV90871.1 nucleoside 2-deoxyribosyltransferase [Sulfurirhabdus autotrophica]
MKIYIAGPDIFRPDALNWAEEARALCAEHGHEALLPMDGDAHTPKEIFQANISLLQSADALIANLNPFRGTEPDSGTSVEVGYALALGKQVVGYMQSTIPLIERVKHGEVQPPVKNKKIVFDVEGFAIEDFGYPLNLMLAEPVHIVTGGLREALAAIKHTT